MSNFSGTGVALVTPFAQGQIDFLALAKLIEHCYEGGINYLVVLGTTGETATLNKAEKQSLIDFVVKQAAGRMPVVVGIGGNNTQALCQDFQDFNLQGVDAILSVSPYYNKPTQEGIYQHYLSLAQASPLPIIIYNVPGRTGSNITAATTLRLAQASDKFIAIKEASGNLTQCMEILAHKPANFQVLSGDDNLTLPLLSLGAVGVISVVGQACPKTFSGMVQSALAGNYTQARQAHYQLFELTEMLFAEGNPGGVKAALAALGLMQDEMRQPLWPISQALHAKITAQMQGLA